MRKIDANILRRIKLSYEKGVPLIDIAKTYGIARQTVSKLALKYVWLKHTSKSYSSHIKAELETRRDFQKDDREDQKLIENHFSEWQVVRQHLQSAIDHKDLGKVELAQKYAETLSLIQNAERSLRGYRTKGRLKATKLRPIPLASSVQGPSLQPQPTWATFENFPQISIGDLFQKYKANSKHLAPSTISHWQKAINELVAFLGHSEASLVDRDMAIRWKNDLLARGKAPKTIESGYIGATRATFNFGLANNLIGHNPFTKIKLPKAVKLRNRPKGFTAEEAKKILVSSWLLKRGPEKVHVFHLRKWAPWLCAYTGARISEICQLRKQDVRQYEDIWCLHLTPSAGSIKTKSYRIVPIHPQLITLGFLEFVKLQPDGCLFSHDLDPGGARYRPKLVTTWVRSIGIEDRDISPNHAWRHRFKTLCRQYGIPTEYHNAITGHENDRSIANSYGDFPILALHREILKLPKIRLPSEEAHKF